MRIRFFRQASIRHFTKNQGRISGTAPVFFHFFFQVLGFKDNHLIRAAGVNDAGDAEKQESIMNHAEALAAQLMNHAPGS